MNLYISHLLKQAIHLKFVRSNLYQVCVQFVTTDMPCLSDKLESQTRTPITLYLFMISLQSERKSVVYESLLASRTEFQPFSLFQWIESWTAWTCNISEYENFQDLLLLARRFDFILHLTQSSWKLQVSVLFQHLNIIVQVSVAGINHVICGSKRLSFQKKLSAFTDREKGSNSKLQ